MRCTPRGALLTARTCIEVYDAMTSSVLDPCRASLEVYENHEELKDDFNRFYADTYLTPSINNRPLILKNFLFWQPC